MKKPKTKPTKIKFSDIKKAKFSSLLKREAHNPNKEFLEVEVTKNGKPFVFLTIQSDMQ